MHQKRIAEALDGITQGVIDRLLIAMPPRHGKSETVACRYPVYRLLRDPTARVLITSYNETFARRFGRRTRNLAREYGVHVAEDVRAAHEWSTAQGGEVVVRGVGSPPTGIGFDLIICDDPIRSREDADSVLRRDAAWEWWSEGVMTRLEPTGAVVMCLTRWHEDDVAARALASEPDRWSVLSLPAIDDAGRALWPDQWPLDSLLATRERMDARSWEALYQQNPTPRAGAFFPVDRLRVVDGAPEGLRTLWRWDVAASASGDYTAGVLMGMDADNAVYVLDVIRFRALPGARDDRIRRALETRPGVTAWLPQDPGAAGVAQVAAWRAAFVGHDVRYVRETGAKEVRAAPLAAQIEGGRVALVRAAWNRDLIEELRQFPLGVNDDQVDALAGALAKLAVKEVRFW